MSVKPGEIQVESEAALVCEALVREIANAQRWSTVMDAWNAILKVRSMSRDMAEEQRMLMPSNCTTLHPVVSVIREAEKAYPREKK